MPVDLLLCTAAEVDTVNCGKPNDGLRFVGVDYTHTENKSV